MQNPDGPVVVQSDRSLLLDVHSPSYEAARDALAAFAELEKSPEHVHTYRVTPLSLWNAASAGLRADQVTEALARLARYGVPQNVAADIAEIMGRFGKIRLLPAIDPVDPATDRHRLEVDDPAVAQEIERSPSTAQLVVRRGGSFEIDPLMRGTLKQKLARLGHPVDDRVGFVDGERLGFALREVTASGKPFSLRPYQREAAEVFLGSGLGHGVIVLPCGAGKTVVGMAAASALSSETLILCTSVAAARQWIGELLDKTTLCADQIGEYTGFKKEIRPVTATTYQIVSRSQGDSYPHFALFSSRRWGLVIYDEVHLLPAPVFRITAEIQSRRRLGLTATLIREDGLQTDVFSLVGPKRFDVPWKVMERTGFIAEALCHEIRVPLPGHLRVEYAARAEDPNAQFRIAAENPEKDEVVVHTVARHQGECILVIGQYLSQLKRLSARLGAPLITGEVAQREREVLFQAFRERRIRLLVVSKVANFSIDLPEASVCIQVSGTFGSRQEEAQRLGRILRPKERRAVFYSLVSSETSEIRFSMNRQLFLTEQGYRYYIEDWTGPGGPERVGPPPERSNVIPFPVRT